MKLWAVKYWEHDGIFQTECEVTSTKGHRPYYSEVFKDNQYRLDIISGYMGETFFETQAQALERVHRLREDKIWELSDRINRIESMNFEKPFKDWQVPRGFEK